MATLSFFVVWLGLRFMHPSYVRESRFYEFYNIFNNGFKKSVSINEKLYNSMALVKNCLRDIYFRLS